MTYSHPHRIKWQRRLLINKLKYYFAILWFICLGLLMLWGLGVLVSLRHV